MFNWVVVYIFIKFSDKNFSSETDKNIVLYMYFLWRLGKYCERRNLLCRLQLIFTFFIR